MFGTPKTEVASSTLQDAVFKPCSEGLVRTHAGDGFATSTIKTTRGHSGPSSRFRIVLGFRGFQLSTAGWRNN